MANQFLVEIHNYISRQIKQCQTILDKAEIVADKNQHAFYDGQLNELKALRMFLNDAYNLNTQQYY